MVASILMGNGFFFGVRYDSAEQVTFHTMKVRIDPQADKKLGFGFVWEAKWVRGGWAWQCDLDLTSEEVHFFARSLASQKECLEQFLIRCIEAVKKIEVFQAADAAPSEHEEPPAGEELMERESGSK